MSKERRAKHAETPAAQATRPNWSERRWLLVAAALYGALTLAVFGSVLFSTDRLISSGSTSDITSQFYHTRSFGFGELARGNFPLWNPHVFAGVPFAANFQSALFYPPNWFFLALPIVAAINWNVALHVFLAGWFTFVWLRGRELHAIACLVGGAVFMFCGPYFAFVYAGNLTNLCTMAWAPLVLWCVDGWLRAPSIRWGLVGSLVVAMQILAGHPQYVYYTALAAGVLLLCSLWRCERRLAACLGFAGMYLAGAALAAVQLVPGLWSASQSVRAGGVPYEFAIHLSLPPENLLTFVAPGFFGTMHDMLAGVDHDSSYWGRGLLWEMTGYVGIATLVLAAYGLLRGEARSGRWALAGAALVVLVLALGGHTPVFRLLFDYLPGFDRFRGSSKFLFAAALFLVALAAIGLDALLRRPRREWAFVGGVLGCAVVLAIAGAAIDSAPSHDGWWRDWLISIRDAAQANRELYKPPRDYEQPEFIASRRAFAAASLWRAAIATAIAGVFVAACGWERRAAYVVAALAVVEIVLFARPLAETCDVSLATMSEWRGFLAERPGDYRIINQINPNAGSTIGALDAFGYEPSVARRYAELMTYAAGIPMSDVSQYLRYQQDPKVPTAYQMARVQLLLARVQTQDGMAVRSIPLAQPLPRLLLVPEVRAVDGRDAALAAMAEPSFDPRKTAILEREPGIALGSPVGEASDPPGSVRIVDQSTDHVTIDAELRRPALLLMTDAFDTDWRVVPLTEGSQPAYEILPADWAFRGVPLAAGKHLIRVEYAPATFLPGAIVSLLAAAGWIATSVWMRRRQRASRV